MEIFHRAKVKPLKLEFCIYLSNLSNRKKLNFIFANFKK